MKNKIMRIISTLFGNTKVDLRGLVADGATVVDVRSPEEYASGHIPGSTNVPLDMLQRKMESFLKNGKPVITCCRSGTRSSIAQRMLKSAGIDAYNGGSWNSLQHKIRF